MKKLSSWFLTSVLASSFVANSAIADWTLQNAQSSVHFISTKKQNIDEIHHFKQLTGQLTNSGKFTLSIDLASVETGIEIRNTRMREQLFKVGTFPTADVSAQLPTEVMQLKAGQTSKVEVTAELSLMQTTMPLALHIQVTKTTDNSYVATSIQPVLISASSVGLQQGVETLQKLAGLPSIGLTVPVSFNLLLNAD
ncbi:YceI family protein [Paraglaciecola aquimarina]|uniref:YceI family protein n=1 Tax=Paraglaciecola aquimarina TaxID=1235557 RepID=A0ABU3ST89_9ALTE|nr:YceI family protein [Paraglaciecola aquimarina]MDU0353234.1 YceI family protein [Paraglaciecola aquimarina]